MSSIGFTILAAIVAFGILIVIHELGHYSVARLCGVKVLRFSVGMGKVIFSRRFGPDQTEWAISILPLGGYVQMLDARDQDLSGASPDELKREFTRQSVWRRIAIVAAGPIANFLLAIALFSALYVHGTMEPTARLRVVPEQTAAYQAGLRGGELVTAVNGKPVRSWSDLRWQLVQLSVEKSTAILDFQPAGGSPTAQQSATLNLSGISAKDLEGNFMRLLGLDLVRPKAVLEKVLPDGPAMRAGLRAGDLILAVDGKKIADAGDFSELMHASAGKSMQIEVQRDAASLEINVTPETTLVDGHKFGMIKVQLQSGGPEMVLVDETPINAAVKAVQRTWETSVLQLKMLVKMLTGEISWRNISGPITIADYAGQTARIGAISYLSFIAFISISLGVMNLLPIPVLDGGLLLYYSLEVLTGRPVSERFGEIAQRAGIGILMTLMIVAVFNDIMRHLS